MSNIISNNKSEKAIRLEIIVTVFSYIIIMYLIFILFPGYRRLEVRINGTWQIFFMDIYFGMYWRDFGHNFSSPKFVWYSWTCGPETFFDSIAQLYASTNCTSTTNRFRWRVKEESKPTVTAKKSVESTKLHFLCSMNNSLCMIKIFTCEQS